MVLEQEYFATWRLGLKNLREPGISAKISLARLIDSNYPRASPVNRDAGTFRKKLRMNKAVLALGMSLGALALVACGNQQTEEAAPTTEPVTTEAPVEVAPATSTTTEAPTGETPEAAPVAEDVSAPAEDEAAPSE